MVEESSPLLPEVRVISRFTRRWDLLILLSVLGLLHNIVWNTWGPLVQTTSKLYGWDASTIAIFANTSSIMFIVMFIPVAFVIRKSLKTALLLASGAMAVGTTLRAGFLTDPEGNPEQFTILCHICAVLNGVSTPLLGSGTMLLAYLWFPREELGTALTISEIFYNLGPGLPFLMAVQMIQPVDNVADIPSNADLNNDMQWYLYSQAISSALFFIFIIIYFPAGPARESRSSRRKEVTDFVLEMKTLVTRKTSWLLAIGTAIPQGVMRAWLAMMVVSLQDVCFQSACLSQGWVNTLAIFAAITSTIASVASVRIIHMSNKNLKLTVGILFLIATFVFFFLSLVSMGIIHSQTVVKAHISILFLTVTGYSLIISSLPLTLKLAMNILSPASEITVACWLNFWFNIVSILFLSMFSISGIGSTWLNYILPVSSGLGLLLILPVQVDI
eukprot:GFUD01026929.1.p1 GENE.GFUD01026929.1~~GFUD01026929.1.p1  ORF type:complete len:445 (-),score=97.62 GFUD01026929.1:132-1466(-)